jgi:chromosome segregation ATPase
MISAWALWAIGAAFSVFCALIGVIYIAGQRRDDKQDSRSEAIEVENDRQNETATAMRERLRAAEIEIQVLKSEVGAIRERWHEQQGETARALASWYSSIIDTLNRQLADIRRQLGRARDSGER